MSFKVKSFELASFTKLYASLDLNGVKNFEDVLEEYRGLYQYIKENNIMCVYEKVFGQLPYSERVIAERERCAKDMGVKLPPFVYMEGAPTSGNPVSSVLVYGISAAGDRVKLSYFKEPASGKTIGTLINADKFRALYLMGIRHDDPSSINAHDECMDVFKKAMGYIKENGFTPKDIVRTWIYLKDIDNTYSDLNTARREFFEENDIGYSSDAKELAASTCIGGKSSEKNEMTINFFCIDKKIQHPSITRIYNKYQNEAEGDAYEFRPTFSRALLIDDGEIGELQVSGTASIDETGLTVFLDDAYNQIKKTLINVSNLLEQSGMDFSNFCDSTCFLKVKEFEEPFWQAVNDLGIGKFSSTIIVGEVCRVNLLFEFDGVAVKKR